MFGGIGCVIATPYTQRIGDIVAGTILIDTRNRTSWEDTVFTELTENYQPRYPQVMQLSDKDINTLKGIISAVRKKAITTSPSGSPPASGQNCTSKMIRIPWSSCRRC